MKRILFIISFFFMTGWLSAQPHQFQLKTQVDSTDEVYSQAGGQGPYRILLGAVRDWILSHHQDNDTDAANELQTISKNGLNYTLSNGGGSVTDSLGIASLSLVQDSILLGFDGNGVEVFRDTFLLSLGGGSGGGGGSPGGANSDIQFNDNGNFGGESTFIYDSVTDRMGLGESNPDAQIHLTHVGGSNAGIVMEASNSASYSGFGFNSNTGSLFGQFLATNSGFSSGIFEGNQIALANYATSGKLTLIASGTSGNITFATGGLAATDERMRIDETGKVGIGVTSITHPLEMASGAHVTSGGVWTDASSRKLKENITALSYEDALQTLLNLEPQVYNYINSPEEDYVGFIAEDVPELVAHNDRKSLSPMEFAAVSVAVLKEQQKLINTLLERVQKLESQK